MITKDQVPEWLLSKENTSIYPCECIGKKKKISFLEKTINDISKLLKEVIFSEEMAFRNGFLQKLDPRIKIITIILIILTVTLSNNVLILITLYLLSCVLAKISRIPIKLYFKRVWFIIPFFTGIMVFPSIFNFIRPGNSIINLINFGKPLRIGIFIFPSELAITKQGLYGAILLIMKVGLAVSLALLLTITTRWANLLKAFRIIFLPKIFITILEMCYRYIFILLAITTEMFIARKSRTFGKIKLKDGQHFVSNAIGSLFGKSYALSEEVYSAMRSRGYRGEPVIMNSFKLTLLDFQWVIVVLICILATFGVGIILE